MAGSSEQTPSDGARAVVADAQDPARRPDVLFRVRRPVGQEPSLWAPIIGFVVVVGSVLGILTFLPS
ncbi:UDP-N-acetylmuramyl pentapeptide phosphotransferase [Microbacterium amylolyticum]|uniref:UDP-N-acetylmuramyl pentapeptide phosphotransferase n=1 Tax=Microbacterium amylolyticum TaxID=936337 RepID=A0ABS4ZF73_9MICO|nr:UDP-N-acetylmuramyl pentapeptide phosphotransferase [Microbacterium amylolyticum]MBP2435941.1 hypothetical protein [Microbacterium amylolyticum]